MEAEQAVIEKVEDVVEAVVPDVVEAIETFRTNTALVVGVAVVAAAAGAAIGYYVADRRLRTKYDDILAHQIEEARAFYATLNKADYPTPGDLVAERHPEAVEAAEALEVYKGGVQDPRGDIVEDPDGKLVIRRTEEVEVESHNIFVNGKPIDHEDWDQNEEELSRTPGKPYVLTEEEFFQNETDFEQMQMTYYVEDDTLVDDFLEIVQNSDAMVGDDNLQRFGHGTKDRHMVYVRNDEKEIEFEIARSEGSYAKEVLGLDDDEPAVQQVRGFSRYQDSDD